MSKRRPPESVSARTWCWPRLPREFPFPAVVSPHRDNHPIPIGPATVPAADGDPVASIYGDSYDARQRAAGKLGGRLDVTPHGTGRDACYKPKPWNEKALKA